MDGSDVPSRAHRPAERPDDRARLSDRRFGIAVYPAGDPAVRVATHRLRTGIALRVAESGAASAPAVVMLHGWGACLYMHRAPLAVLPAEGYHVVAPDLRGHGFSEKPIAKGSYTLDAYLDDVIALIDSIGVRRAVIVAQSMGGSIALNLAARAPGRVRGMVLINPTGLTRARLTWLGRMLPRELTRRLGPHMSPRWLTGWVLRHLAYGDASRVTEEDVDQYWVQTREAGYVHALRSTLEEFDWKPLSREQLAGIRCPVMVVEGDADRLVKGVAAAASAIPGATGVVVPGGHTVNEECPDDVCGRLVDFLRRLDPPG